MSSFSSSLFFLALFFLHFSTVEVWSQRHAVMKGNNAQSSSLRERINLYHQNGLVDSLAHAEIITSIDDLEANYYQEKKERELVSHALTIHQDQLSRLQGHTLLLALGFSLTVMVMAAFLVRSKSSKKKMALDLERERKQLEIAHQLEFSRLKSDFFTHISHQFRTPLTLILTPLAKMIRNETSESLKQSYEMIQRNANQLLSLVNQFLELSKIESGHDGLRADKNDLLVFMREMIRMFKPLSDGARINIILLHEVHNHLLYFDKEKLEKVFYNLLSNAFRRTSSGGSITIHLKKCVPASGNFNFDFPEGGLEISVRDTGKSIPAYHLPYILNRFYGAGNEEANEHGIGLSLAREIVELHCGRLQVRSDGSYGAEFIVTLPFGKHHLETEELAASSSGIVRESEQAMLPRTSKILITSSREDLRKYMEDALSDHYDILMAENGAQCLMMARLHNPGLIISDTITTDLEGHALAAMLRKTIDTSHIPILLLVSRNDKGPGNPGDSTDGYIDGYILKPFSEVELLTKCRFIVEQQHMRRALFQKGTFKDLSEVAVVPADVKFLKAATETVTKHLQNPEFNANTFCREMGMNQTDLDNKIIAITGLTLPRFVRCLRLWKAMEIIRRDTLNTGDICSQTGFSNRQFFIRSFRQQYGMTPAEYSALMFKERDVVL